MLDNIELNVMHTVDHVEKAREETKRAVKYQGQARKVRLWRCLWRRGSIVCAVSCSLSLSLSSPPRSSLSPSLFLLLPPLVSGGREP